MAGRVVNAQANAQARAKAKAKARDNSLRRCGGRVVPLCFGGVPRRQTGVLGEFS